MNKITITLAVLAVAAGGFYLYQPDMAKRYLGLPYMDEHGSYIGRNTKAADWEKPETIQRKVGPEILSKLGAANRKNAEIFYKSPENRLKLAQWMLAQKFLDSQEMEEKNASSRKEGLESAKKLYKDLQAVAERLPDGVQPTDRMTRELSTAKNNYKALKAESKAPHSIAELIKTPEGKAMVEKVVNNQAWAEQFSFTGECMQPAAALSILTSIAKKNPNFDKTPILRDIATATAIEFARSNWKQEDAIKRNDYFVKHWKRGDLNAVFDTLPFWQRKIVCGAKGDNAFGSVESLEWSNEHVKLPAEMYPASCWRCGYKLYNPYGDSIHGPLYGAPFDEIYGSNKTQFTYEIGGVCGGLSHFGTFSAVANGVPALTAGEPGHCAFVVLIGDKWTPSYSLSWERGLHWTVWKNNHRFASLHMASELFSDKQAKDSQPSDVLRVAAGELKRQGKVKEAMEAYREAVAAQPNNYQAWREYSDCIRDKAPKDIDAWSDLNQLMCKLLVPSYPEIADALLDMHVYKDMAEAMAENKDRLQSEFLRFWSAVCEMGPDRWHIEDMADRQMKYLGIDPKDTEAVIAFAGAVINELATAPKYIPIALGWSNKLSDKMDAENKQKLLQATLSGISKMSGGEPGDKIKILAPMILAAEKARDMSTFQSIRAMLPPQYGASDIPKFEPFPGKLMSQNGLLWTSTTCGHDVPCEHPGILEPEGGRFHSDNEENPYIVVQLTKQANLSGIVVVGTPGNKQRLVDLHIEVSDTAKDDDWHEVGTLPNLNSRVGRIDLQEKRPLAKYVRIRRGGPKQFFHLNGVYVYGKPAA